MPVHVAGCYPCPVSREPALESAQIPGDGPHICMFIDCKPLIHTDVIPKTGFLS